VSVWSADNVRKKKRIIRKTKQKECTTLASGLGVVQRRKRYKMNSVSLVSGRVRKKKKIIEKEEQPWRADWGLR